jgi:protein SCO1
MPTITATYALSEAQFEALVEALRSDSTRRAELTELLREDHPVYDQRSAAAIVRMRGWVLVALTKIGLTDAALLLVLEELDTGRDAYLVAAAARALRSYAKPVGAFAPFVMRAITNIRYHEDYVAFEHYGEYVTSAIGTTPLRELLATLVWLGPHARGVLPELEELHRNRGGGFSNQLLLEIDRVLEAISRSPLPREITTDACCSLPTSLGDTFSWVRGSRCGCETIESTVFEDHDGATITFREFFCGHPSVVVFFYTRCDNPQKCSLTITKLARLQNLLLERGLAEQIRTAAITYDPGFDIPERLRGYAKNRGVLMNANHRMLRAVEGINELRPHFKLGVNFIGSLVNRHRIEVYVLDAAGGIAASFERIHWDEQQIVERAVALLNEERRATPTQSDAGIPRSPLGASSVLPIFGTLATVGVAFFPKCPFCWMAYWSVLGITGIGQVPYSPWLQPLLAALMLLNLLSVWMRARTTRRIGGFLLVTAGAIAIVLSRTGLGFERASAFWGVALTLLGSLVSALSGKFDAVSVWRPFLRVRQAT